MQQTLSQYFDTERFAAWSRRLTLLLVAMLVWAGGTATPTLAQADLQIIHNSPDPNASTVDIYVDNEANPTVDDLNFRGATSYLSLSISGSSQQFEIDIAPGNSSGPGDAVATQNVTLDDGEDYVAVATGELGGQVSSGDGDFQLLLKTDARENVSSTDGDVELFGVHGSPDAPTVDVVNNNRDTTFLDNIAYPELQPSNGSGYAAVDPGTYALDVTVSSNGNTAATFEASLGGFADQTATVLASGYLTPDDEPFSTTPEGFGLIAVDANGNVVQFPAVTPTQIVHNSPDPNASTVDVYLDDTLIKDDLSFRGATPYVNVPSGTQTIGIAPGNSSTADDTLYAQEINFANGTDYVAVATGELGGQASPGDGDFQLLAKTDAQEFVSSEDGDVELFGVHGSPDAPTVDVQTNDGSTVLLNDISFTEIQPSSGNGLASVDANVLTLDVNVSSNGNTAATFEADLTGFADRSVSVLASGYLDPTDEPFNSTPDGFGLIAVDENGNVVEFTAVTRTQIVHNSPDPRASTVDVYLDDTRIKDDLSFRGATPYVNVPSGTQTIGIAPGNSSTADDTLYAQEIPFETGQDYVAVASGELGLNGNGAGDFQLLAKTDAREFAASENGDVEFFGVHGSPDAPTVDVQTNDRSATLLSGISYPGIQPASGSGYNAVGTGTYTLDVNASGSTAATFEADLSGFGNQAVTVLASGYLSPEDESQFSRTPAGFGLIGVDKNGNVVSFTPVARAQVIHNAPDPAASTVDVYLDDSRIIDDLTFRGATGYVNIPAGTQTIGIAPGNSSTADDTLYAQELTLDSGTNYSVIASGVLNPSNFESNPDGMSTGFQLLAEAGVREFVQTSGNAEFYVVHGAPDAPTVDASAGATTLADNAAYTDATGYTSVSTGTYPVSVTGPNGNISLATFTAPLSSSGTAVVLASGFYTPYNDPSGGNQTDPAFGLFVAFADGSTAVLPVENQLAINEFLADPTTNSGGVDANGDGTVNADDEFVEIVNRSGSDVDVSGYTIEDADGNTIYTFPSSTTLPAGNSATIFGGGSPSGIPGFTDTGLDLADSGDDIVLTDGNGNVVQSLTYPVSGAVPQSAGVSTARNVNAVGGFALHSEFGPSADASPGLNNDSGAALPVEMAGFSATLEDRDAVLQWRTLSEKNNSGFAVQHKRPEGSSFRKVGFRDGQGTTTEETSYRYRVSDLSAGTHTFRLKQVDLDGSSTLTDAVTVEVDLDKAFRLSKVRPNPLSGPGTISLQVRETQKVTVELFDVLGRQVRTLHDGSLSAGSRHQMRIDGEALSNGTYLLRVEGETFSNTQKISVVK